jgi:NDP-sugar pyrophosphorylase family protein
MLQIIIPAAGRGSRFQGSNFVEPKPLISWKGKNMIQHVIENFQNDKVSISLIKRQGQNFIVDHSIRVYEIDYITDGPASTVNITREDINLDQELIVINCDQIIKDWNQELFLSYARKFDSVLGCFISNSNKNSYVKVDDNNHVTEVREKVVISNLATNGLHYWKKARYFFESYDEMVKNNDRTNGEFYVAPTFNYLIKNNYKIGIYLFNQHFPVGTPEDLEKYLNDESNKN